MFPVIKNTPSQRLLQTANTESLCALRFLCSTTKICPAIFSKGLTIIRWMRRDIHNKSILDVYFNRNAMHNRKLKKGAQAV